MTEALLRLVGKGATEVERTLAATCMSLCLLIDPEASKFVYEGLHKVLNNIFSSNTCVGRSALSKLYAATALATHATGSSLDHEEIAAKLLQVTINLIPTPDKIPHVGKGYVGAYGTGSAVPSTPKTPQPNHKQQKHQKSATTKSGNTSISKGSQHALSGESDKELADLLDSCCGALSVFGTARVAGAVIDVTLSDIARLALHGSGLSQRAAIRLLSILIGAYKECIEHQQQTNTAPIPYFQPKNNKISSISQKSTSKPKNVPNLQKKKLDLHNEIETSSESKYDSLSSDLNSLQITTNDTHDDFQDEIDTFDINDINVNNDEDHLCLNLETVRKETEQLLSLHTAGVKKGEKASLDRDLSNLLNVLEGEEMGDVLQIGSNSEEIEGACVVGTYQFVKSLLGSAWTHFIASNEFVSALLGIDVGFNATGISSSGGISRSAKIIRARALEKTNANRLKKRRDEKASRMQLASE